VGKMSRDKGARAEREVKDMHNDFFERIGYAIRLERNQMQTLNGGYDLVGLTFLAIEVKMQETFSLPAWWKQTLEQARPGQYPILFYRRNRVPWRVRMAGHIRAIPVGPVLDDVLYSPAMVIDISTDDYFKWLEARL